MVRHLGRYRLHDPIASGGMAMVHLGRMIGPAGFSRTVAIKRLHAHLAGDPDFVTMFLDEARLAARVQHPNVVPTLDVVSSEGELFLVMDFVLGTTLSQLLRVASARGQAIPAPIASAILLGTLYGLHAAHEACDDGGEPLHIVHRDVSPQNVLVGVDGVARVVDFGVAKAASRVQATRDGEVKGKLAYMAPEQLLREPVDRRADIHAAGVVLWETLAGRRLFTADDVGGVVTALLSGAVPKLEELRPELAAGIDALLARALARSARDRFATAAEFAAALETLVRPAAQGEVGQWVLDLEGDEIRARREVISAIERAATPEDDGSLDELAVGPKTPRAARILASEVTSRVVVAPDLSAPLDAPLRAEAPRARPRRWVGAAIAGAILVGGGTVFAARTLHGGASVASAPVASAPLASAPLASALPAMSALPAVSVAAPAAVSLAAGESPSAAPPAHRGPARLPPRPRPAKAAPSANGCDPSYTVDLDGVKRFKPWCL